MANFYSGKDGVLKIGDKEVARLQNWSFSMSMAVIESTSMGDTDRVLHNGLRSYSGSARAFYYNDTAGGTAKDGTKSGLSEILTAAIKTGNDAFSSTAPGDGETTESDKVKLQCVLVDGSTSRVIEFGVWITSVGMSSSVGEVSSVDFSWEADGAPTNASAVLIS